MDKQNISQVDSIRIVSHNKLLGYVEYNLEVRATTRFMHPLQGTTSEMPPTFHITSRFDEMREVHRQITEVQDCLDLPSFPPKKLVGNKTESYINTRIQLLNDYFTSILKFPSVRICEPLMKLITPRKGRELAVIGRHHTDNDTFIINFLGGKSNLGLSFPVDLVANYTLSRISSIRLLDFSRDLLDNIEQLCTLYQGVLFCYNRNDPSVEDIGRLYDAISHKVPSLILNLNCDFLKPECAFSAFIALVQMQSIQFE